MWGTELYNLITSFSPVKIALVCHHNADPDAVGSAYAMKFLIKCLFPNVESKIIVPMGISIPSKRLLEKLNFHDLHEKLEDYVNMVILIDTCSLVQLGSLGDLIKQSSTPLVVIDHHKPLDELSQRSNLMIVDADSSSTAEVVYTIFRELTINMSSKVAFALLTGLIYDSKRFMLASQRTFMAALHLISYGADYSEALEILSTDMDMSERIARLKGAQRAKILKVKNWLVAVSHVSSFEASVARALMDLGADVAFVAGSSGREVRVSSRSSSHFYNSTGIHLGRDVMEKVGKFIGGGGGGHATAAGANGKGEVNEVLNLCIKLISEKLS